MIEYSRKTCIICLFIAGGFIVGSFYMLPVVCDAADLQHGGVDIAFYGKIVDQHNTPIPGVPIDYYLDTTIIGETFKLPETLKLKVVSDNEGCFVVQDKGYQLFFDFSEDYPGYEFSNETNPKDSFGYGGMVSPDSFVATQANPFTFILRKKNKPAYLIGKGAVNDSNKTRVKDITQAFEVSFYEIETWITSEGLSGRLPVGAIVNTHKRRKGEKDIKIQGVLSEDGTQCNLEVVPLTANSGIIASDDFLSEAPETGYQSSISLNVPRGEEIQKYLYLKLEDGAFYQRSVFRVYLYGMSYPEPELNIKIQSWINPEGLRNLEYDSDYNFQEMLWRQLLYDLRYLKKTGGIKTLESKKLVEEYGLASLPEWESENQFLKNFVNFVSKKKLLILNGGMHLNNNGCNSAIFNSIMANQDESRLDDKLKLELLRFGDW